jgi:hypothetical protein
VNPKRWHVAGLDGPAALRGGKLGLDEPEFNVEINGRGVLSRVHIAAEKRLR